MKTKINADSLLSSYVTTERIVFGEDVLTVSNGKLLLNGKEIGTNSETSFSQGHNVGEQWISMDGTIPYGGLAFLGQTVSKTAYKDLYDWVVSNNRLKTEEEWQNLYSTNNNNVAFYANVDDSTFRLPSFKGYLKANTTAGDYIEEGLPNINGRMQMSGITNASYGTGISNTSGAIVARAETNISSTTTPSNVYAHSGFDFDASKSNSIYGNSTHVTPETNTILIGVYATNKTIEPSEVELDNLRLDLTNASNTYVEKNNPLVNKCIEVDSSDGAVIRQKDGWILELRKQNSYGHTMGFALKSSNDSNEFVLDTDENMRHHHLRWNGNHILVANKSCGFPDYYSSVIIPYTNGQEEYRDEAGWYYVEINAGISSDIVNVQCYVYVGGGDYMGVSYTPQGVSESYLIPVPMYTNFKVVTNSTSGTANAVSRLVWIPDSYYSEYFY